MFNKIDYNNQEVLILTSYPSNPCGIATYSKDLRDAITEKFSESFSVRICALENENDNFVYPKEVKYILNTSDHKEYIKLAENVNADIDVKTVFIQHEFGLFGGDYGANILSFLHILKKPVSITFHTVLPSPNKQLKKIVQSITSLVNEIVVMTNNSLKILKNEYAVDDQKISVIPHGNHMVKWNNKEKAKRRYQLDGRLILSTFGLLSTNKSIETALDALPSIVEKFPNILYLIIGRTHPNVVKNDGEFYRNFLENKIKELGITDNVKFINKYVELPELLEYLQLTDVYLFTSKDPNQAVSGTFSYALSNSCPVISTPIPHAKEVLQKDTGILIDFGNSEQLANAAIDLLGNPDLIRKMSENAFLKTRASVWENSAIAHASLLYKYISSNSLLQYNLPKIDIQHINTLTDTFGMIQFCKYSVPDIDSGYTLDDNSRALIAIIMHYDLTRKPKDLELIKTYINFIEYCQKPEGDFYNYVDKFGEFHVQNHYTNLEDSNGRAIWALGSVLDHQHILPPNIVSQVKDIFDNVIPSVKSITSPRAMAFAIKGLYFGYKATSNNYLKNLISTLSIRLSELYKQESESNWNWFEGYFTYANSILPEAMLYAYLATGNIECKKIALESFEFLLSMTFTKNQIKVVSNRSWHHKNQKPEQYGEQPIDVAYSIMALDIFYKVFQDKRYQRKMDIAFSWFLGNNHLNQVIYNPLTGGCHDGLEQYNVNLNQGAESSVCYLNSRLILEKLEQQKQAKTTRSRKRKAPVYSTREALSTSGLHRITS